MSITITEIAKVKLIEHGIGTDDQFLRITIRGGGCAGLKHEASFDSTTGDSDVIVFEEAQVKVIVDGETNTHIDGLHIDFSTDLMKGGFKLTNTKATASCGCGSSYSK